MYNIIVHYHCTFWQVHLLTINIFFETSENDYVMFSFWWVVSYLISVFNEMFTLPENCYFLCEFSGPIQSSLCCSFHNYLAAPTLKYIWYRSCLFLVLSVKSSWYLRDFEEPGMQTCIPGLVLLVRIARQHGWPLRSCACIYHAVITLSSHLAANQNKGVTCTHPR